MTKKEWRKLDKKIEQLSKADKNYRCENCGRRKDDGWQIHHHHFIGRKHTSLRWVNENIFVLCAKCHQDWEQDPQEATTKARNMRGEIWYKEIAKIKNLINKKTFQENELLMDKDLKEILASYRISFKQV